MARWILAALLLALMSAGWSEPDETIEEYGCICDGAQGECRPHPQSPPDTKCEEE